MLCLGGSVAYWCYLHLTEIAAQKFPAVLFSLCVSLASLCFTLAVGLLTGDLTLSSDSRSGVLGVFRQSLSDLVCIVLLSGVVSGAAGISTTTLLSRSLRSIVPASLLLLQPAVASVLRGGLWKSIQQN